MRSPSQRSAEMSRALIAGVVSMLAAVAEAADGFSADGWWHALSMQDYNTRVVAISVALLGASCGAVGVFMVLRRKALFGDAISHATLPGVAMGYLIASALGLPGKHLPFLLAGATLTALIGMGIILLLRHATRLPEDAALGIVLSVFFGAGVALLGVIQQMENASAAGLETFIYGKAASMLAEDGRRIAVVAIALTACCALLFKEFRALCFDSEFARVQGWPVRGLDALMMGMVVAAAIIGLQAVGLMLVISLLIIPPAAARFWTHELRTMVILSAAFGAASGVFGALWSALAPQWPTGGVIVLVAAALFFISMLTGSARGVLFTLLAHLRLERRVAHQHVLRTLYEMEEKIGRSTPISETALLQSRHWRKDCLLRALRRLHREGVIERDGDAWALTPAGRAQAARLVRNHRLWELYLIRYAAIAPMNVDRDADRIEHVLGHDIVVELERLLDDGGSTPHLASPHPIHIARSGS